jgi:hypothetical protein
MMGSIKNYESMHKKNERLQQEEWANATRRMSGYKNKTEEI